MVHSEAIASDSDDGESGLSKREQVKHRILDATMELIGLKGPHLTTVRDITAATGANVSAVNYYFGSKDDLIKLALAAIFRPVNAERRKMLRAAEEAYAPDPVPCRVILEALIRPMIEARPASDGGTLYLRAVQHIRVNPGDPVSVYNYNVNQEAVQIFIDTLARTFPALSHAELAWRYEFARGAAVHMLSNSDPRSRKMDQLIADNPTIDAEDKEVLLRQILALTTAGFSQPPVWTDADLVALARHDGPR